jgi:hypothetical protein
MVGCVKKACVRIAKQVQVWEAGLPHGASPDAQSRFMVPGRTVTWQRGSAGFHPYWQRGSAGFHPYWQRGSAGFHP